MREWLLRPCGHRGGCESKPRPCPIQCGSIQHAVCDPQSGVCQCELGYQQLDQGPCVLMAEVTMTTEPPLRHRHITETVAASEDEIQSRFYYPKDDDMNVWMFAMIGIGCVFIVFVAVSLYLMCHSSAAGHPGQQEQTLTVQQAVKP
uniref:Uncharacterized protein n=1 Tax=Timema cristinae TaxID=61476 RepID=A0A7R9D7H8_TIMCR|nr:unnamed protein product [Timema cristinae]